MINDDQSVLLCIQANVQAVYVCFTVMQKMPFGLYYKEHSFSSCGMCLSASSMNNGNYKDMYFLA